MQHSNETFFPSDGIYSENNVILGKTMYHPSIFLKQEANQNLSNIGKFVDKVILISCQLGSFCNKVTLKTVKVYRN